MMMMSYRTTGVCIEIDEHVRGGRRSSAAQSESGRADQPTMAQQFFRGGGGDGAASHGSHRGGACRDVDQVPVRDSDRARIPRPGPGSGSSGVTDRPPARCCRLPPELT